jgi:glucoamylase
LHWAVAWTRAALTLTAAGAVGLALVSGGSPADPRTPAALRGMPPPFLGTAVLGDGGLTAAVDAYGDVVDLRAPGPAGAALIDNPIERQVAGTVPAGTGIVPRISIGGQRLPLWRADSVSQRYRRNGSVLLTRARFGRARVEIVYAAAGDRLACLARSNGPAISLSGTAAAAARLRCDDAAARRLVHAAERSDRRWLSRARPLGHGAPNRADAMYRRSLLTLRALTDRSGAAAAGARDGWAYVWPRDAATAALAFAAAGYDAEARRVAGFLLGLDLGAAARFEGDGDPVPGRAAQGDASGWVRAAARAAGLPPPPSRPWRNRADYQEGGPGAYLGNALAAPGAHGPKSRLYEDETAHGSRWRAFATPAGLLRRAGDPAGLDSAAAWAVRPFSRPALYPAARRTLLRLVTRGTRFGITPGEAWPGVDPWTAPTAWSAWSLAALSGHQHDPGAAARDRHAALGLLGDLRRAATPAGALPERVDAQTGVPRSTTPLAWSHAFAILALRQLWP